MTELLFALVNSFALMLRILPTDSFPRPLSKAEEQECLERLSMGDIEARNTLVEHNMRLISHILKKYYTHTEDIDDLVSVGTVGLIKGINTYKPDKGVRLATYASRCIENEILMYFRSNRKNQSEMSLSEALDTDGDSEGLSMMDVVADELELDEQIGNREICRTLQKCVEDTLSERDATIIKLRYGLGGGRAMKQQEVAELCHISRSYVSRIEKKALAQLREALGEDARLT